MAQAKTPGTAKIAKLAMINLALTMADFGLMLEQNASAVWFNDRSG